ncbi:c(7)-type cytochrome triheme domain-containing protein [Desulfurivibrio dismutans]|uniref:c(7)-type cytochrome triheme domain-containing protein n=1 Tax=Desulfurivibrio dismutans TaxID=1398908 RepID=UPI0023DAAC73|nr:c(7)-type cytochrome triheme domain-containing protein [Desulfurivibrio alkaliphilus]MDF1614482.1 cytochrome c3 family protein [Desulfurivibrio alkaliphilus]
MKLTATIITILAALAFVGTAIASMPGNTAEFDGGPMGKVVFSGQIHADAGMSCNDCHTDIFQMKREVKITMADHNAGNYCFSCHQEGGKAFAGDNCARCHQN